MKNKFYNITFIVILSLLFSAIILAYSILSNSSGYPRSYADNDIPFIFELNDTTPGDYLTPIIDGAETWENVNSAYFEFEYGGLTPVNTDGQDNTNLVFFDFQGVNFSPGTNTIAYSRTWTQGSGSNYRAVESDLVWNARDFPPSPTGASGQQDLQSVITHEFGHHLGLGHAGPVGGPPGVGPLITAATMYGTSASGDTTKRSLHIDDIAGVSQIYPDWRLQGTVFDSVTGLPIENAKLYSDLVFGSIVGPLEYDPGSGRYQTPGYYVDSIYSDVNGDYSVIALKQNFNLSATYFGYGSQAMPISFNAPAGIGQTETIFQDFLISQNPNSIISGSVVDSSSGQPVMASVQLYVASSKPGKPQGALVDTVTDASGQFNISAPALENYLLVVSPVAPYSAKSSSIENLNPNGEVVNFSVVPAQLLLVDDDAGMEYETYFESELQDLNITYHYWNVATQGVPDEQTRNGFLSKNMIWFTGDSASTPLSPAEESEILAHVTSGGKLFLTGQDILQATTGGTLMNTLGIEYDSDWGLFLVLGVSGDPVSNGLVFNISGFGGANNQTSSDVINITDPSNTTPIFHYGTGTANPAGVRFSDNLSGSKVVFLGFGFEAINDNQRRETLLRNSLEYLNSPVTGIEDVVINENIPNKFSLKQNYPNPFNPSTTIEFDIAAKTQVQIIIYNAIGQRVKILLDQNMNAGTYKTQWDGNDAMGKKVSSGVYFYKIQTESGFTSTKKLLLMK